MNAHRVVPILLLLAFPLVAKGQTNPVYTYTVPNGGYAPNGNLVTYTDSVTGTWSAQYDNLNRLKTMNSTPASGPYNDLGLTWIYDSFGNRLSQTATGSPSVSVNAAWANYYANNRMTTNQAAVTPGILQYDAGGNMTFDGRYYLAYDAENRVCAVYDTVLAGNITQYLYNAEGQRVAKGHPQTSTTTPYCSQGGSDFVATEKYILGLAGEQITQLDGSDRWQNTNIYANGQLLATYDQQGSQQLLHFNITDPLGTKRVQASASGAPELNCPSLPFGDGPDCTGTGQEATRHRFTGKERDSESGLDYFGARYYGSNMGRWMSPDWASTPEAVPYAKLNNPQSLNLYTYVANNPLGQNDADGHDWVYDWLTRNQGALQNHQFFLQQQAQAAAQQQQGISSQTPKYSPYIVVGENNPTVLINGHRGRDEIYKVKQLKNGAVGYSAPDHTLSLHETLLSGTLGKNASICDHNNCSGRGTITDSQGISYRDSPLVIRRDWTIDNIPARVWNPNTNAPAAYQILHLQVSPDFVMEYKP